jgi:hypothetical protein
LYITPTEKAHPYLKVINLWSLSKMRETGDLLLSGLNLSLKNMSNV